jgi:hypothetical protein
MMMVIPLRTYDMAPGSCCNRRKYSNCTEPSGRPGRRSRVRTPMSLMSGLRRPSAQMKSRAESFSVAASSTRLRRNRSVAFCPPR